MAKPSRLSEPGSQLAAAEKQQLLAAIQELRQHYMALKARSMGVLSTPLPWQMKPLLVSDW